jgi:DNA-binding GntR family transcriptional regulator
MRQAILDGYYAPGENLREEKLAVDLNMSPTPIREALLVLEAQGLVSITPRRGATVIELSRSDIIETYQIRAVLESFATRMAIDRLTPLDRERLLQSLLAVHEDMEEALKADDLEPIPRLNWRFHYLIYRASGSTRLVETVERLWNSLPHYWLRTIPGRAQWAFGQHSAIIAAIDRGASAAAEEAMSQHISVAAESLIAHLYEDDAPHA